MTVDTLRLESRPAHNAAAEAQALATVTTGVSEFSFWWHLVLPHAFGAQREFSQENGMRIARVVTYVVRIHDGNG